MGISKRNTDFYGNPIDRDEDGAAYKSLSDGTRDYSGQDPTVPSKQGRETYESRIREKNTAANQSADSQRAPAAEEAGAAEKAGVGMGSEIASQSAGQGDMLGTVGGGMMMSGNPYLMAAGLGLKVYSAGEANKRAKQEQQRQEYNARVARRQEMMSKIAEMRIE